MAKSGLQIVDLSRFSVQVDADTVSDEVLSKLAEELRASFTTDGFLYVRNHGIRKEQLESLLKVSNDFFSLPPEIKEKYRRPEESNGGYVSVEREALNPERPADLKEAYNVMHSSLPSMIWPCEDAPNFREVAQSFYEICWELSKRILILMGIGLDLKDRDFLWKAHVGINTHTQETALRILNYPPLIDKIKPNQVRCGEHSDYGSITLLFQDDVGGLEIRGLDGEWRSVDPIPDTIVVNVGDLMQRWTSDTLVSTKHRVMIPDDEKQRLKRRNSVAFFVHPNNSFLIECLDGSNRYEPITSGDYLRMRFAATY